MSDKSSGLESDFVRVLAGGELGDDGDTTNEAQVFLDFDIVQDNLVTLVGVEMRFVVNLQR